MRIRVPLAVDEQGWSELTRIHEEAFQKVMELRERTETRLLGDDEVAIPAVSVQLCFEVIPNPGP